MRVLRISSVNLHRAVLPDLTAEPHGPMEHDPVRTVVFRETRPGGPSTNRVLILIQGRRAVATALRSGQVSIKAQVVSCSEREARRMGWVDDAINARMRRSTREYYELLVKLVNEFTEDARLLPQPFNERKMKAGRSVRRVGALSSVRQHSREMVATMLGIRFHTIMRAERFLRGRLPAKKASDFKTFGLVPEGDPFLHEIGQVIMHLRMAAQKTNEAALALARLQGDKLAQGLYPEAVVERAHASLKSTLEALYDVVPRSLCFECKGLPGRQEGCRACQGRGWVGRLKGPPLPPELLQEDRPMVRDGEGFADVLELLEAQR